MAKGPSLPLDGRRGLAGDVVDHARDTWHLVHDAPRDVVEKLVRQPRPVRGHEVDRLHRPQRDHVVVAATVAHNAHRAHRQEDREGLTHAIVEIVPAQLLDVDRIRAPQELGVLGAHLAEDPHREPRSGEGVAMGELARQPELGAEPAHLVLEQLAQRLDELETHPLGEPAHVVVRLDDLRLAGAGAGGLDDVGIDRALGEELDAFETLRLLVEDLDEGPADHLALGLGVGDAGEGAEKARLRVDADDLRAEVLREDAHHRLGFAEAQQAVVDEYADQLLADRAVQERGDYGGVDAAREPEQHRAVTDLRAEACDGVLDDVADAPEGIGAADLAHEALEELGSLGGVRDLGMKLQGVEAAALVPHGREGNGAGRRGHAESRWQRIDPVAVAHRSEEHTSELQSPDTISY